MITQKQPNGVRSISFFFLFTFLVSIFLPTTSYSLTSGPQQPEYSSFAPVSQDNMVDLRTGKFNYSVPLLNVPGPNGGYPIALNYMSGISMDQEASWVGLGWSLGVGEITRDMRGIPDDFNGDEIYKNISYKPQVNVGIGYNATGNINKEVAGFKVSKPKVSLNFSNYSGLDIGVGFALKNYLDKEGKWSGDLNLNANTNSGFDVAAGMTVNLNSSNKFKKSELSFGTSLASREGVNGFKMLLSSEFTTKHESNWSRLFPSYVPKSQNSSSLTAGVGNILISTDIPSVNEGTQTNIVKMGVLYDNSSTLPTFEPNWGARVSVSTTKLKNKDIAHKAYGTLYDENATGDAITDFNRNEINNPNKGNNNIGYGVQTDDVFHVSTATGFSGKFGVSEDNIMVFSKTNTESSIDLFSAAVELKPPGNTGVFYHVGADLSYGWGGTYQGEWTDGAPTNYGSQEESRYDIRKQKKKIAALGNVNFSEDFTSEQQIENAGKKPFKLKLEIGGLNVKPVIKQGSQYALGSNIKNHQGYEQNSFKYKTFKEIKNHFNYSSRRNVMYDESEVPDGTNGSKIDYTVGLNHHIAAAEVLDENGIRYQFDLPVYNLVQKNTTFSIGDNLFQVSGLNNTSTDFTSSNIIYKGEYDASVDNNAGLNKFFQEVKTPKYATNYLLTSVVAPNYVDLTGDGVTDDDFGGFTKFNYTKLNGVYKWRTPYYGAHKDIGHKSNPLDDRASFEYGETEQIYLNSVETKTHIAVFEIELRQDARGAANENPDKDVQEMGGYKRLLKKIVLYEKEDYKRNSASGNETPIAEVKFKYDYSLCKGVLNNDGTGSQEEYYVNNFTNEGGKLTLKEVIVTRFSNLKGENQSYTFGYDQVNPDYTVELRSDRWGQYQENDDVLNIYNAENPYTRQNESWEVNQANWAESWNLKEIFLPSKGRIEIDYEKGDYGFVQDKRAMEMTRIAGFSNVDGSYPLNHTDFSNGYAGNFLKMKNKYRRVYFELNEPVAVGTSTNVIKDYLEGIKDEKLYFKVFEEIKNFPDQFLEEKAQDYVEGFCEIEPPTSGNYGFADGDDNNQKKYAYFTVKSVSYNAKGTDGNTHPFKRAGWQYLQAERNDLLNTPIEANPTAIIALIPSAVKQLVALAGFYAESATFGYCKKMSTERPSFVRLNSPDYKKKGGGSRVSDITFYDNWQEGNQSYGTHYEYVTEDGKSSGVADYEPLLGGDENPFRQPSWFKSKDNQYGFNSREAFTNAPFCEAHFPSPQIIYSRVVVSNKSDSEVTKAQVGSSVNEFYTSKDFPTKTYASVIAKSEETNKGLNLPTVNIPFVGSYQNSGNGYSQAFRIELNDMSGKPKRNSSYEAGITDFATATPTSQTEYRYFTNSDNTQLVNTINYRDSYDNVVDQKGVFGVDQKQYIILNEQNNRMTELGLELNFLGAAGSPIAVPIPIPIANYSNNRLRTITSHTVIHRKGILKEVETFKDGSSSIQKNVFFDKMSASPVLTKVDNEWEEPIYTYNYPSHWAYKDMGGAFINDQKEVVVSTTSGESFMVSSSSNTQHNEDYVRTYFSLGDEFEYESTPSQIKTAYLTEFLGNGKFKLQDHLGNNLSFSQTILKVVRSGRRNHVSSKNYTISTLGRIDYLQSQYPTLPWIFEFYNSVNDDGFDYDDKVYSIDTTNLDCTFTSGLLTEGIVDFQQVETNGTYTYIVIGNSGARMDFVNPPSFQMALDITDFEFILSSFTIAGLPNGHNNIDILAYFSDGSSQVFTMDVDGNPRWSTFSCINNNLILNTEAVVYQDQWGDNHPYFSVGNPKFYGQPLSSNTNDNKYSTGKYGVWLPKNTYVYQVDRLQTNGINIDYAKTKINIDGEYEDFENFDFTDELSNDKWDYTSEITKYSPYGFALEEKSRSNFNVLTNQDQEIYNSQIYGYANSLMTASAVNASYFEFGSDGFEETGYNGQIGNYTPHGNVVFLGSPQISQAQVHTGKYSIKLNSGTSISIRSNSFASTTNSNGLSLVPNKKYNASMWVYTGGGADIELEILQDTGSGSQLISTVNSSNSIFTEVDGWTKIEHSFIAPVSAANISTSVRLTSTGQSYLDDVRVAPYDGGTTTNVYDQETLWLKATLDGLNYATFFNYDEEGKLVQVRKETEKGIFTVSSGRQNTSQN